MSKKKEEKSGEEKYTQKWRIKNIFKDFFLTLATLFCLFLVAFAIYSVSFQHKNYAHQYIGNISLGGKSKAEAEAILQQNAADFLKNKIVLADTDNNKTYELSPSDIGLTYDIDKTTSMIYSYGKTGAPLEDLLDQFKTIFSHRQYKMVLSLNENTLDEKIASIATGLDQPEKDYSLVYSNGTFTLSTDRASGKRIDQEDLINDIKLKALTLSSDNLNFALKNYDPKATLESAQKVQKEANAIIADGDLTLNAETTPYTVSRDTLAGFLGTNISGDKLVLKFNDDQISAYLSSIAKNINVSPVDAKVKMDNGKITIFQPSVIGKTLDLDKTRVAIENALTARENGSSAPVSLVINQTNPAINETEISSLGINELIGTATTSFSGSPANRIHNITVGANAINGAILNPGETFSTLAHLGTIDASSGYLQELVIKDNQTVPDYGGGLCQVSTTLFRAAINAGMLITDRSPHAYRVGYFEPLVGMDATIFSPSPDFKFVNNYQSHVLIQSKIEGTKITFEFYGTKDGRAINVGSPTTSDVVPAGDPVMVQTDTLPVGQKKQLEKAHNGITARFDYKVTAADGTVLQQKTFISKYVPWPEKWLVGTGTAAPTCSDGVQNGDESGVDCGGSCATACPTG